MLRVRINLMGGTNTMELNGKTAFITGGASGLGLATARNFKAAGADVFLYDLNAEALEYAATELAQKDARHAAEVAEGGAGKKRGFSGGSKNPQKRVPHGSKN